MILSWQEYEVMLPGVKEHLTSLCKDLDTDNVHWVHDGDEAVSWCRSCCVFKVRHLKRHNKREIKKKHLDYLVDGGFGSEEDGPQFCAGCGKPLECTLTNCGIESELDHFLSDRFVNADGSPWRLEEWPIDPVTAFELLNVFEGADYADFKLKDDLLRLAQKVSTVMTRESSI
jgi:hypothetical protein